MHSRSITLSHHPSRPASSPSPLSRRDLAPCVPGHPRPHPPTHPPNYPPILPTRPRALPQLLSLTLLPPSARYPDFKMFDRVRVPKVKFAGLMQYDGDLKLPNKYLVPPPTISKTSGEYLVKNGLSTFACSETQKYGHVTFFWNGNRSGYFDEKLETYLEIPSDTCSFNEKPLMKVNSPYASLLTLLKARLRVWVRVRVRVRVRMKVKVSVTVKFAPGAPSPLFPLSPA